MTMFQDGVKDEKVSDSVKVKDIAEIVAESIKWAHKNVHILFKEREIDNWQYAFRNSGFY